jgi:hypothetical protein
MIVSKLYQGYRLIQEYLAMRADVPATIGDIVNRFSEVFGDLAHDGIIGLFPDGCFATLIVFFFYLGGNIQRLVSELFENVFHASSLHEKTFKRSDGLACLGHIFAISAH